MFDLTNNTAVVVGGTSGIGLTLAKGLAEAGADVVATGRRMNLAESAARDIRKLGRHSLAVTTDVTSRESIEQLLRACIAEFSSVEILLNCAGGTAKRPTLDAPEF